jgi:hypothetical protein
MSIGQQIIEYICQAGLLRVSTAVGAKVEDCPAGHSIDNPTVVFVWSANAEEQLTELVHRSLDTPAAQDTG